MDKLDLSVKKEAILRLYYMLSQNKRAKLKEEILNLKDKKNIKELEEQVKNQATEKQITEYSDKLSEKIKQYGELNSKYMETL